MPSKKPQFVIRTEKEILNKISFIAAQNERSGTQEIVYLIKQKIKEYESENGQLIVGEDGTVSIAKPSNVTMDELSITKTG